ncbi:hypothetical protein GC163_00740 [bacterium]|nr:hypothetical protein [bacterium]
MRGLPALVQSIRVPLKARFWLSEAVLGIAVAASILSLFSAWIATWGTGFGVQLGMICGIAVGLLWHASTPHGSWSDRQSLFWLATIWVVWPSWFAVQLELLEDLPTAFWNQSGLVEASLCLSGILTWAVPVAVWSRLLLLEGTRAATTDAGGNHGLRLMASGLGLLLAAYVIVPAVGVSSTLGATLLVAAAGLLVRPQALSNLDDTPTLPSTTVSPTSAGFVACTLGVAAIIGWQTATVTQLFSEVMPATVPQWLAVAAWLAIGCAAGNRQGTQTHVMTEAPLRRLLWGLTFAGTWQLVLAACLIPLCLWLNSRITTPILLEVNRLVLLAAFLFPLGYGFGRVMQAGFTYSAMAVLAGMAMREYAGLTGIDSIVALWLGVVPLGLAAGGMEIAEGRQIGWWCVIRPVGIASLWGIIVAFAGLSWPEFQATKLLFSTTSAIASRSGWETKLLPQLDSTHRVATQASGQGRWTLWQSHGGQLQLRNQGVPVGALTTQPDWAPQYGPEVAAAVWPLVLVDQPARVLLLGVGSSASLQAALTFPVSEVMCCEADDGLMNLLEQDVFPRCGFHPFQDERCHRLRQPAEWLLLPASEQFDVIVSSIPSAALPQATSMVTTEYYERAAQHLTPQGIFCQRFNSIDFGPKPLLTAMAGLQRAFPEVVCMEVGTGEFLLLGAHDPAALVKDDLPQRLERPHVMHMLSRCQWDWCTPLNFPAYDRAALAEAVADVGAKPLFTTDSWLAFFTPRELLRWSSKPQEIAAVLQKPRSSARVYPLAQPGQPPQSLNTVATSRQSRYLSWLSSNQDEPLVLRRLAEVVSQAALVKQFPDSFWWEYRKELREQLQDRPRTGLQLVRHESQSWHPEDVRRKNYFVVLGRALSTEVPEAEALIPLEQLLEPYDPLLTLFAHQELAELYARGDVDPARELSHRLHVIYYAPAGDASVRNVIAAIDHVVQHPDAVADDAERFEILNGLLQVLRSRWEIRNQRPSKSAKVTLQEIERSLVSVERAIDTLAPLAISAGYTTSEWETRQLVLERLLIRPFRSYRDQLVMHTKESRRKTQDILQKAAEIKDSETKEETTDASLNSP